MLLTDMPLKWAGEAMDVRLSKQAQKYYLSQTAATRRRLKESLAGLGKDPMLGDIVPIKGHPDTYRLRVGKLRVLFAVSDGIIKVTKIDARGQAYKK